MHSDTEKQILAKLVGHDAKLSEQSAVLVVHSTILAEHSAILAEHSVKLDEQTARLTEHSAILSEHSAILTGHSVVLAEHSAKLIEHDKQFAAIRNEMATGFDQVIGFLMRLEEESTFTHAALLRLEEKVERHDVDIRVIKYHLQLA